MLELLAPAGSMESVQAAVQNGAGAVYLGYGDFNARRNAKNFTREEAAAAVSYCHLRDTKVHLTLNTLLTDRELPRAAQVAAEISEMGVDAVIVQDLGVARMLRQVAPDVHLHASTQMTVHSLDGVKECADLGMTRAVLSRELSRDQIAYICQNSPIEIEVFGHGALCMCYSGQCYLSSLIGGRSGNRGLCAQPCRLKYGWGKRADEYPLSLKDMSLVGYLKELEDMGVACLKLEGRMKRPEYVAIVTRVYADALREGREPTAEELRQLEAAFSRQGFTQGYFLDQKGPDMFGTRQEGEDPRELFAQARTTYESGENRKTPVRLYAWIQAGEPAQVAAEDSQGRVVQVEGPVPEAAVNVPLTREKVEGQLGRTGGTPFHCEKATALVDEGLSLPLSALNALRRQALEKLSQERARPLERKTGEYHPGVRYENPKGAPLRADHPGAAGPEAGADLPPLRRGGGLPRRGPPLSGGGGGRVRPAPPHLLGSGAAPAEAAAGSYEEAGRAGGPGGHPGRGAPGQGAGLPGPQRLRHRGVQQPDPQGAEKAGGGGGHRLLRAEICPDSGPIIHNHTGRHSCEEGQRLVDRKGEHFPVVKAWGCRNEILNGKTLFLADKAVDYQRLGLTSVRLLFTTESPEECVRVLERYLGRGRYRPGEFTRGLYYRDVE